MKETLERSSSIAKATDFASMDSFFYHGRQLDRADQSTCPNLRSKPIRFISDDTFTVTRKIINENKGYRHVTAVLNMASDEIVGGIRGLPTGFSQEGALCMSSTLYSTLQDQQSQYPWRRNIPKQSKNAACIYSPDVVIFKDSAANQYRDLPEDERKVVSVFSLAAPRAPRDIPFPPRLLGEIREKMRMLCRLAVVDRKSVLVLGAFGCGEYRCPPKEVAQEMKNVLVHDKEFKGWFEEIVFAIYDKKTCEVFQEVFEKEER